MIIRHPGTLSISLGLVTHSLYVCNMNGNPSHRTEPHDNGMLYGIQLYDDGPSHRTQL